MRNAEAEPVRGTPFETFDMKRGRALQDLQPITNQLFRLFLAFPYPLLSIIPSLDRVKHRVDLDSVYSPRTEGEFRTGERAE